MKFFKKDVFIVLIIVLLLAGGSLYGLSHIIKKDAENDNKESSSKSNLIPNFKYLKIKDDSLVGITRYDLTRYSLDSAFITYIIPTGWQEVSYNEIGYYYEDIDYNLCDISLYKINVNNDYSIIPFAYALAKDSNNEDSFGKASIYNIDWYVYKDDRDYSLYINHIAKISDSYYLLIYHTITYNNDIPNLKSSDKTICKQGYQSFLKSLKAKNLKSQS